MGMMTDISRPGFSSKLTAFFYGGLTGSIFTSIVWFVL